MPEENGTKGFRAMSKDQYFVVDVFHNSLIVRSSVISFPSEYEILFVRLNNPDEVSDFFALTQYLTEIMTLINKGLDN